MAKGAGLFVLTDSLLLRVVLPLTLLAAVILRFNLFSFIYLLVLLVSTLLPGPTLKSQRVATLILLAVLLVFSAVVSVGQALFQISLATNYTLTACEGVEPVWRQSGFVQYNIPAVDVVRHLLPDVVVFIVALVTLFVNARVVALHRRKEGEEEEGGGGVGGGGESGDVGGNVQDGAEQQQEGMGREREDMEVSDELEDLSSGGRTLPFPAHVQCYWRTPKVLMYFMDFAIFTFLGLSGVAIPSLTSFIYYAVFILLLAVWSVHLRLQRLVRGLRVVLILFSSLHLLLLDLYQFQSAQDGIPIQPNNTTPSLLARLFGLTPIVLTDCTRPTELKLWPHTPYTVILSPIFILVLFWLLATELRLWLFTPHYLWSQYSSYCLPVLDQHPSSRVVCITRAGRHREQTLWTQYGTYTIHGDQALESDPSSETEINQGTLPGNTSRTRRLRVRKVAWEKVWKKVVEFAESTWSILMSVSYAFAIVAMMVWSVLYVSWPALVLLLWACAIWLIPRVNPRNSLYYTSPLLVVYALALLLLQYINSLQLTSSELPHYESLGMECTEAGAATGCMSLVLLFKTLLAILFFAAFHEFVRIVKERVQERRRRHIPDGEVPLTEVHATEEPTSEDPTSDDPTTSQVSKAQLVSSHFYASLKRLLSTYWVLAVVGAFLLVTLAGQPSLLKTVYLVFFFIFLITYQISRRFWYYLTVPMWWFLIVYAVLDLVLIYTYQFDIISNAWDRAYQPTILNISSDDLFASIGLFEFDTHQAQSLIVSLVPPTVFIAVMALQLRYFRPDSRIAPQYAAESGLSALDLSSLLPKFVQERIKAAEMEAEEGEGEQEEQEEELQDSLVHISEEEAAGARHSLLRQRTASVASSTIRSSSKLYRCYQLTVYLFAKTKQIVVDLVHLLWRFLELHMHKIIALVLFAVALSEISAGYWILLLMLLVTIPLPYLSPLVYPVLTLYLGFLTTLKMIYQLPIVQQRYFDFNRSDCRNVTVNAAGSDADWLGFSKAENFAAYIYAPIISGLLLSLWFSARRYQAYHYHTDDITVEPWEKGALFLKVTRCQAERSIVGALKFLINHFYEMYGVEVSWVMLAITVAVRIDVYGVFYALVLGLLLFTPRRFLAPVWLCYLLVHGFLLLLQYFFVLGLPPGVCLGAEGNRDYPWSVISPSALKKWLFLPEAQQQILDKNLLYADFLVYLLVCLQMHYFHDSPLKRAREETGGAQSNLFKFQFWLDYVKVVVFRYSFWLSLFLLFFTAASRVSLFGVLYLLLCFVFLYRGEEMLKDRQRNRHRSWALLRAATWMVLLIRVTLQILDCVYSQSIDSRHQSIVDPCVITLLFNGGCNRAEYYGSPGAECSSGPQSVGLWVDALNFAVVTVQIILFDTPYSEAIRIELKEKEENALYFADVFDKKVEERQQEGNAKRERELQELRDRADELSETTNRVDHFLYAGVTVPSDIQLRKPLTAEERHEKDEAGLEVSETLSITDEEPKSKTEADVESLPSEASDERSKLAKAWKFVYNASVEFVDTTIEWLESTSALYREVVGELKPDQLEESKETTMTPDSAESIPFAESADSYGTTDETPRKDTRQDRDSHLTKQKAIVEVHKDPTDEQSLSSYKAAVVEGDILAEQESGDQSRTEEDRRLHSSYKLWEDAATATRDVDEKEPAAALEGPPKVRKTVLFDERGDVLIQELKLVPTEEDQRQIEEFEAEFGKKAKDYSKRPKRLLVALLYAFLAHSEYIVYFLVILNAIINGSILSLVYVFLLFLWGMLSIPWPSKIFWLTMIFYTMIVLTVKYGFQFSDIPYWRNTFTETGGLYPPRLIGILYHKNFFSNAVWDMLLLIALLFHRGLLRQSGLWRTGNSKGTKFSNILKQVWFFVKRFVSRLLNPNISQGATDYYVPMLVFDVLCLLTIAFGVSSFGIGIQNENVAAVATFIQSNYIPLPFVIMLLLQFLSMVVDRGIYLRRSLVARFVFHILLLVIWHVWLFFLLPSNILTGRPFTQNVAAQCIYFFKCCYFIMSALQIVAGYPNQILGYFLSKKSTTVSGLAFQVYRLIPILSELREAMDWTFTDTTLSLLHWFRVQEIYAQIYLVKVRREREKSSPRYLGEPQSFLLKILLGAVIVTVLVLLIWGPLLVISLINTTSQPNPPIAANIRLAIAGFQPLVEMDVQQQSIKALTADQYNNLTRKFANTPAFPLFNQQFQRQDFHQVLFSGESTSLWTISPPSRDLLRQRLNEVTSDPTSSILLQFTWSFTRAPSTGLAAETVSGVNERTLTNSTDYITIMNLLDNLDISDAQTNVYLPNLYPSFIDAPANGASGNLTSISRYITNETTNGTASVSGIARLNMTNGVEWWTLAQNSSYFLSNEPPGSLEMIVYSERIAPPIFNSIAGIGIIGLYVSVVLVIGRFMRSYITQLPSQLLVDEIVNPDPLLQLCSDIFLVRESKDFRLEEILVGKLFFIFRSPERIIKLTENTKPKQD